MDDDTIGQAPRPADAPAGEIVGHEGATDREADTEGHSLLTEDLARAINSDRVRESERLGRDSARLRDARLTRDGGFLRRFRRR